MVCPAAKRSRDAQTYLDQLCQVDVGIARAHTLLQAFLAIVRERRGDDLAAITAGLTLKWMGGAWWRHFGLRLTKEEHILWRPTLWRRADSDRGFLDELVGAR